MGEVMDSIVTDISSKLIEQLEELIRRKFKEFTGEELENDNMRRVTIVIPQYNSVFDKRKIYMIDKQKALEIWEPYISTNLVGEVWKMSYNQKYKEYAKESRGNDSNATL